MPVPYDVASHKFILEDEPAGMSGGRVSVIREAYRDAGVDIAAGEHAVDLMRQRVEATFGPEVLTGLGSFAAAVALPAGMREPVLVSATDGVGTKTAIAALLGRYDTIGIDLVAMCADDVVCLGARPFFFLDYVAVERLDPDQLAALVDGVVAGCRLAGCALIGGETAEHPGVMAAGSFDMAGFCVGIATRADLMGEAQGRPGDALIGIAASGLHSNGFSLVRKIVAENGLDLAAPFAGTDAALGDALLDADAHLCRRCSRIAAGATPDRAARARFRPHHRRRTGRQRPARTGRARSGGSRSSALADAVSFRPPSPSSPA